MPMQGMALTTRPLFYTPACPGTIHKVQKRLQHRSNAIVRPVQCILHATATATTSKSKQGDQMLPARSALLSAAATAQQQQPASARPRRRRTRQQPVEDEGGCRNSGPKPEISSSMVHIPTQHQHQQRQLQRQRHQQNIPAVQHRLLYVPFGYEAQAAEAARELGWVLQGQQPVSASPAGRSVLPGMVQSQQHVQQEQQPLHLERALRIQQLQQQVANQVPSHDQHERTNQQEQQWLQQQKTLQQQKGLHLQSTAEVQCAVSGESYPHLSSVESVAPMQHTPPGPPAAPWQLAVTRRLAAAADTPASSLVKQARLKRLQRGSSNASGATVASPSVSAGVLAAASDASLLQQYQSAAVSGQGLSPEAEADLCEMYQRHLQLDEQLRMALQTSSRAPPPADAAAVAHKGLMAQQLLLQLYQPLIISRSTSAAALHPDVDVRELTDAAARAVLTAAAKYDRQKSGSNTRLSSLAAVYIKTAIRDVLREYQSAPVVLPADVVYLKAKLSRLQQQLTAAADGSAPSTSDLAAAAGLSVAKVQQVMDAAQSQSSGLVEVGGGDDDSEMSAAGGDVNLLHLDVTQSQEDLDYIAGAVKRARSGLDDEQQLAEASKSLATVMQQFFMSLQPKDRTLLALRLGLISPDSIDITNSSSKSSNSDGSHSNGSEAACARGKGRPAVGQEKISDRIPVIPEDMLLKSLESMQSLEESDEGMSIAELSRLFNMPRQRGSQLMKGVVQQLRERLWEAAGDDAELAMLLVAAGGKLGPAGKERR